MVIRLALWIGRRGYESVVKVKKKIKIVSAAELKWDPPLRGEGEQVEIKWIRDGGGVDVDTGEVGGDGGEDEEEADRAMVITRRILVNWETLESRELGS